LIVEVDRLRRRLGRLPLQSTAEVRKYLRIGDISLIETDRRKVVARLERDGWVVRHGGEHDVYKHPNRPGRIVIPRHRKISPGVARTIAGQAGWTE
jgi:predicted RNA binding protein YcfA (HicA-like mRNA interferase family)